MRPGGRPRVLVLSYTTFRMHKAEVNKVQPDVVFCDEAHTLKNAEAQVGELGIMGALCAWMILHGAGRLAATARCPAAGIHIMLMPVRFTRCDDDHL
jgi:hypothetical protein